MNTAYWVDFILVTYTISLTTLLIYSAHGFIMLFYKHRYNNVSHDLTNINLGDIVTVQLPLYNEMYMAERLINAVCKLDYPKDSIEIQVLDDSNDETSKIVENIVGRKIAEGFDIKHIQRCNRNGYKAGALKEGLKIAKGKFIAIFDADFIPPPDFLKNTLAHFYESNIGMVQTRWTHLNENKTLLTRVQAFALNGHFAIEQKVRNDAGFFINFNGTGGVWRKECILNAGNWDTDTITEDLDLSYRAQMKGWKFIYLKNVTTPAELPETIGALKSQQFRWTKGAIETAKKILPSVWKSDLSLRIKLQSTLHLTNNFVFPFVALTAILNIPMLFIKNTGGYNLYFQISSIFVIAFASTFLFYISAQKSVYVNWGKRALIFPVFLAGTMGLSLSNTKAVLEGMFNKKSEFVRTPKFNFDEKKVIENKYLANKRFSFLLFVEIVFAIYSLIGVIISLYYLELSAFPFNFMFFCGFFSVSVLSLKEVFIKNNYL